MRKNVLKALDAVLKANPNAIVGGSLALYAIGLLIRAPDDLDLVSDMKGFRKLSKKFPTMYSADTYPDVRGGYYDRRPLHFGTVKGCCFVFKVAPKSYRVEAFGRSFRIQDPLDIIAAKRNWSHIDKHRQDLKQISETLTNTE